MLAGLPAVVQFPVYRLHVQLPKDRSESVNECLALLSTIEIRVASNRWTQAEIKLPILGKLQ